MAYKPTETLPIVRDTELILQFFMNIAWVNNIPKVWRYNVYPVMLNCALTMVTSASKANEDAGSRVELLKEYMSNLLSLKVLTRRLTEQRVISPNQSAHLSELYEKVGKQANGWKAYTQRNI